MNQKLVLEITLQPSSSASSPVLVILLDEAGKATPPPAEEVTCLVVRVVRPGPVITEVAAELIVSTGLVTRHQTGH